MTELEIQFWSMVTQAVVGLVTALIGIAGVLVGHFVLKRSEEKKALTEWWERYALTEGVDPVLDYVNNLEQRLMVLWSIQKESKPLPTLVEKPIYTQQITVIPVPHTAIKRLITLTGEHEIDRVIFGCEYILEEPDRNPADKTLARHLFEIHCLIRLLKYLHNMFSVSTICDRGQTLLAEETEAVQEAVRLFNGLLEAEYTDDYYDTVRYVERLPKHYQVTNIFASKKGKARQLKKLGFDPNHEIGLKSKTIKVEY